MLCWPACIYWADVGGCEVFIVLSEPARSGMAVEMVEQFCLSPHPIPYLPVGLQAFP